MGVRFWGLGRGLAAELGFCSSFGRVVVPSRESRPCWRCWRVGIVAAVLTRFRSLNTLTLVNVTSVLGKRRYDTKHYRTGHVGGGGPSGGNETLDFQWFLVRVVFFSFLFLFQLG